MTVTEWQAYDEAPAMLLVTTDAEPPLSPGRARRGEIVLLAECVIGEIRAGILALDKPFPGETVSGRLRFVASAARENTRTFRTGSKVPNSDGWLRDGMSAATRIPASGEAVHMLSGRHGRSMTPVWPARGET
jgi:hypothetical protein